MFFSEQNTEYSRWNCIQWFLQQWGQNNYLSIY